MLKQYWEKIPNWLKNRYAITSIAFVIWMLFFDSNDAFMLFKLRRELSQIRSEKEYYQQRIEEHRPLAGLVRADPAL